MTLLPMSITLEEHYTSHVAKASEASKHDPMNKLPPHFTAKLTDLHGQRIKNMDENGVAIQVVSHTPIDFLDDGSVIASNDELAEAVRANPDRLAGFAALPMGDAQAAARELERCVKELGFVGALLDNHTDGNFYDGPQYDWFWAKAEELGAPIYLHPNWPSQAMEDALYSGEGLASDPKAALGLGASVFGWHASTATTVLRLIAAGVFDRHPKLKIVIGHSGELLPYMFDRISRATGSFFSTERGFAEVMRGNVWITTSGMFDVHSLRCLLGVMPADRVLFSVDYPFSDNRLGREYLERIREEGLLDEAQLRDFAFENARKLLFGDRKSQDLLSRIDANQGLDR